MRPLPLFALAFLCLAGTGCPKKDAAPDAAPEEPKPAEEAGAAPASAAPVAAPVVTAKNVADVARFPAGESALDNVSAKTVSATTVMTGPKSGKLVTPMKAGTDVVEIASFQDCFLVTFLDPKSPADRLLGWIPKEAFSAAVVVLDAGVRDAGPSVPKCAANQALVALGSDPVCKKRCSTDADCKTPTKGACALAASATPGAKAVHVCTAD